MDIGMLVYSLSGNTLSVAERLKESLTTTGHAVTLERVETVGPATLENEEAALRTRPTVTPCDALVLATPVRGGRLPSPMARTLEQLPSLEGKDVAFLVTGFFPFAGWGREQVIAELTALCESQGATVLGAASVGWFSLTRGRQIKRAVDRLGNLF